MEPELIVLRSDPMPEAGMHEGTVLRVEFHDHGAKTRMTLSDGPYPREGRGHAEAGHDAAIPSEASHGASGRPAPSDLAASPDRWGRLLPVA